MTALKRLPPAEFTALMATLFATLAFSIDAMLPALPQIAAELSPAAPNRAQLVVTALVFGMGLGTMIMGPLSDRFGRKPVIIGGAVLYCLAALMAYIAPTLQTLLIARVVQGLGAAAPRVVAMALIRDLYKGREMARIMSFAMMVFMVVPAAAPLAGQVIITSFGWRATFLSFILFAFIAALWLTVRQAETLSVADRRPLSVAALWQALREVLAHRTVLVSITAQTLTMACLFGTLSSIQSIFDQSFGRAESFPLWFGLIALGSVAANVANAKLVVRLGMRLLVNVAFAAQALLSLGLAVSFAAGLLPDAMVFPAFMLWSIALFSMVGLTMGNLNAIAMEPLGHIAGMAASVIGSLSTVASMLLAVPLGQAFDGTPLPLVTGVALMSGAAYALMRFLPRT